MISQYDENLQTNEFFQEILTNHPDIINKVIEEAWIICIPRTGSLHNKCVSSEDVLDHVLIPNPELPHTHYTTLSRKPLRIDGKSIVAECDELSQTRIRILFEETHYVESTRYKVWCIDRPITQTIEGADFAFTLTDLSDCVDLLWSETFERDALEQIHRMVDEFFVQHDTFAVESLQSQRDLVGGLYSQCLQVTLSGRNGLSRRLVDANLLSNIKISVEAYMQSCMSKKLFLSVCTAVCVEDAKLNKIVQNLTNFEYEDLNMPEHLHELSYTAKCELGKINRYSTILGKINCLRRAFFSVTNTGKISVTSDDLLLIFVYIILKLGINNWIGNLTFIKDFNFSVLDVSDENSFLVATLEAAIHYIRNGSVLNDLSPQKDELQERIKTGDTKFIDEYIENADNSCSNSPNLCHPLCVCSRCEVRPDSRREKPLLIHVATVCNKLSVIEYLISRQQNVNAVDKFGSTALHYAAQNGSQDILLLLIDSGASVNAVNCEGNTPLHLAVNNGHENCVKALLYSARNVNVGLCNEWGNTPLHMAAKWGYVAVVTDLIEAGASVKVRNKSNLKPADLAQNYYVYKLIDDCTDVIQSKKKKKVQFALKPDSTDETRPHNPNEHGTRPKTVDKLKKVDLLLKAVENNDLPLTCFYLGFPNPKVVVKKPDACHPLCDCVECASDSEPPAVERPASSPLNVNVCNAEGYTALHVAAKFGRTEILRLLLDAGARPNLKTYYSLYAPLHLACVYRHVPVVRELVKCGGCEVDARDARGNTAIFYACVRNDYRMFEVLLKHGADVRVRNNESVTVLQEARRKMLYNIVKLVKENGGDADVGFDEDAV